MTTEGKVFLLLTITLGAITVNTGLNLLYLLLALLLSAILVSGILSELSLRGVEVARRLPAELWAARPAVLTVEVRNSKAWLPSFSLHLEQRLTPPQGEMLPLASYLLYLKPRQRQAITATVVPARRGWHALRRATLGTRFPFGLFVKRLRLGEESRVLVYPQIVPLRSPALERAMEELTDRRGRRRRGAGMEFQALREFRPGDNPRWIHWRSTARQGRLMTKELEQERLWCVNLLLDGACEPGGEEAFERAVSIAASLCCDLDARGCWVLFATVTDRLHLIPYGHGRAHLRRILRLLATVAPQPAAERSALYEAVRRRSRGHAATLLVSSAAGANDRLDAEASAPRIVISPSSDIPAAAPAAARGSGARSAASRADGGSLPESAEERVTP
ncbi:MAG: DUF58 domain-containing protein [Candidatus Tectomicrobia bacterium]|nr:DUF58 domain-containing protein [Candidatus Tectomicrobia bacterium]